MEIWKAEDWAIGMRYLSVHVPQLRDYCRRSRTMRPQQESAMSLQCSNDLKFGLSPTVVQIPMKKSRKTTKICNDYNVKG